MAKPQFNTSDAFRNRRGLDTGEEAPDSLPASGMTVTKSVRFSEELWTPLEAELRARGLDASNGIRMICAEWLRRELRR